MSVVACKQLTICLNSFIPWHTCVQGRSVMHFWAQQKHWCFLSHRLFYFLKISEIVQTLHSWYGQGASVLVLCTLFRLLHRAVCMTMTISRSQQYLKDQTLCHSSHRLCFVWLFDYKIRVYGQNHDHRLISACIQGRELDHISELCHSITQPGTQPSAFSLGRP